jgi:hypothetical protein
MHHASFPNAPSLPPPPPPPTCFAPCPHTRHYSRQAIGATSTRMKQLRESKVCLSCGSTGAMSTCNGCHFAQYCNEICLQDHWREHAATCNGSRRTKGPESSTSAGPALARLVPSTQPLFIRAIRLWLAAGIELGSRGPASPNQILVAAAVRLISRTLF